MMRPASISGRRITVTADDYGLTRRINDTILEAADRGALTQLSVLANGYAVDHALAQWRLRAERLALAVHLNLTEGKPLAPQERVPRLVDRRGNFRHSPFSLLVRTVVSFPAARRALRQEIELELSAQVDRVRSAAPGVPLSVDGHQHVQMIPLVCSAVAALHRRYGFNSMRVSREPLFRGAPLRAYVGKGMARHAALNVLAHVCRRRARAAGLPYPDFFVGSLMSGQLTPLGVRRALAAGRGDTVEIGTHPGEALPGELASWTGDVSWHYSPWRSRERAMLCAGDFPNTPPDQEVGEGYRAARFAAVGSAAFVLHFAVLYALTDLAGWWYLAASTLAWAVAFLFSFSMQKLWTFGDARAAGTARQMSRYFFLQGTNIALNAAGMYALVEYAHLWYLAAQALVALALALWTYVVSRLFIFTHRT